MTNVKDPKAGFDRMATPLKAAVWFAVLGFIVLAIETPHWGMSADTHDATAATSARATTPTTPPDSDYFPARFPAPKGETEAASPTF